MKKKHSRFSASASQRWLACPQSVLLAEKSPAMPESEYAKNGTAAHDLLEKILNKKMKLCALPDDFKELKGVAEWVWDRLGDVEGSVLHVEAKISLDHIHPELFGTLDIAIADEFGRLLIADLKWGQGVAVDAENNSQLIFYAIGLAKQYNFNFRDVELIILQPRARDGDTVKNHVMPMTELLEWEKTFADGVTAALNGGGTNAGDHCSWCPASLICPELSKNALTNAQADFNDETGELKLPDPNGIAPARLSKMLSAFPLIENWIEAVREYAHNALERGEQIDGWKVVEKRATRKWVDADKTSKDAKKKFGEKAFSHDLLSPAQLEKVAGKEWVEKRCSAIASGTTLVPESDKRQAVNQIEKDFGK